MARGGFTLIETLVATVIVAVALVSVSQLVLVVSRAGQAARDASLGAILTAQKVDALGAGSSGAEVTTSGDAWRRSEAGAHEYLDAYGRVLGAVAGVPGAAVYVRRWSVVPLPGDAAGARAIEVSTGRLVRDGRGGVVDAEEWSVVRAVSILAGEQP